MKYFFFGVILFFSTSITAQDGIQFDKTPFTEILAKAKKEKKLIFVDAMASWCGPCKMMEKNIFSQKEVADYYNSTFINAKLDMEKGEGIEFAKKYAVRSYPSYLFIDGDGQLITRNLGYMAATDFIKVGQEAKLYINAGAALKAEFETGSVDPQLLAKLIQTYAETDYDLAKRASERYFLNKRPIEYTKDEVSFLIYFIKDFSDANYKYFLKDKAEIVKLIPLETYTSFNNQILMNKISAGAIEESTKTINDKKFLQEASPLLGESEASAALSQLKMNYYEVVGNFNAYEKAALDYYKNTDKVPNTELLKAAWNFSEKASNQQSLKTAVMWAEKAVMQQESVESTYILALLYRKTGKTDEAKLYAKHSINIAKGIGKDAALAEKLLSELN